MRYNELLFVLFLTSFFFQANAQNYTISGRIIDHHTEEAIPFTNIYLHSDPTRGTTSDYDGNYQIEIPPGSDTLIASSIGYLRLKKAISGSSNQKLTYKMVRSDTEIDEVVVLVGENPADIIIRKVIDAKAKNNPNQLSSFSCDAYDKLEFDLSNLSARMKDRKVFKPFKFVFDNIDSTTEEEPFLPFFLTETTSKLYYTNAPKRKKEVIQATKISGIDNESLNQFLGTMYEEIEIYDNWIPILSKDFVSPISNQCFFYYRFYLVDSGFIENKWCYKINFRPKNGNENTFYGDLWVHDSTYAVAQISMQTYGDPNLNFVKKLSIYKDYINHKDSIWLMRKDKLIVDFININEPLIGIHIKSVAEKSLNIIGRKTAIYTNYSINNPTTPPWIEQEKSSKNEVEPNIQSDFYWQDARPEPLSENESQIYQLMDTLKSLPTVKSIEKVFTLVFSGFYVAGPIEFGNLYTFYSKNEVEGVRLKLGVKTGINFSKRILLSSFVAYGFKDKKVKYGGEVLYLIRKKPRQSIKGVFRNEIVTTSERAYEFSSRGLTGNLVIRRREDGEVIPRKLLSIKEVRVNYAKEWTNGLRIDLAGNNRRLEPFFNFSYVDIEQGFDSLSKVNATEVNITTSFAYKQEFLYGHFNRIRLSNKYPLISFSYTNGLKKVFNSQFNYQKISFGFEYLLNINPIGKSYIDLRLGKVFGDLPYLLLHIPRGNDGIFFNYRGFNILNEYEFVTDRYAQFSLDHHFDGVLFGLVPGIKKLKLRSFITFRSVIGDITDDNRNNNIQNFYENTDEDDLIRLRVPEDVPYVELGTGIENILNIIRLDAIWRLTYRKEKGSNFGIRASLQLDF